MLISLLKGRIGPISRASITCSVSMAGIIFQKIKIKIKERKIVLGIKFL